MDIHRIPCAFARPRVSCLTRTAICDQLRDEWRLATFRQILQSCLYDFAESEN